MVKRWDYPTENGQTMDTQLQRLLVRRARLCYWTLGPESVPLDGLSCVP